MAQAFINPLIVSWARNRAGVTVAELSKKLGVKERKLNAWENGEEKPTFKQAQNLAHHTYIPFGYLFLGDIPAEELPIPDLRTVGDRPPGEISLNLLHTIRDVMERQLWYQEYRRDQSTSVEIVASVSANNNPVEIVRHMKLQMELSDHPIRGTWEEYTRDLIAKIESLGVLVMRSGMVGSNTHRPLSVEEFRGFAIADQYAPIIFINTADCPEARLFTLIHEFAHIALGKSGISDGKPENQIQIEKLCNSIAAEFLAPEMEFRQLWDANAANWLDNLPALIGQFHVSQWVIARRALELNLIPRAAYWDFINGLQAKFKAREKSGAPSFGRIQTSKVSKRFAQAVVSEALSGRLLLRDAWKLIGIKPSKLSEYARKELA